MYKSDVCPTDILSQIVATESIIALRYNTKLVVRKRWRCKTE